MNWLLFLSQLPTNPSGLRVAVWRKLHAEGALGLQNGVWLLPDKPEQIQFLEDLCEMIQKQGASSQIFNVLPLTGEMEQNILQRFQEDRAEEYAEIKEQCSDFLCELEKEIERKNFNFAEYEENEQDLNKLETWFSKINRRDFLGSQQAKEAEEWLEQCRLKFQDFTTKVFVNEDPDHSQKMKYDPGVFKSQ
jgi:hypothetical protein